MKAGTVRNIKLIASFLLLGGLFSAPFFFIEKLTLPDPERDYLPDNYLEELEKATRRQQKEAQKKFSPDTPADQEEATPQWKAPNAQKLFQGALSKLDELSVNAALGRMARLGLEGAGEYVAFLTGRAYQPESHKKYAPALVGKVPQELEEKSSQLKARIEKLKICLEKDIGNLEEIQACRKQLKQIKLSGRENYLLVLYRPELIADVNRLKAFCNFGVKFKNPGLMRACAIRFNKLGEDSTAGYFQKIAVQLNPTLDNLQKLNDYLLADFKYESAIKLSKRIIKKVKGGSNFTTWNTLGKAYFHTSNFQQAIKSFEKARKFQPKDARIYNNIGLSYFQLNNNKKAREFYEKALKLDPDYVKVIKRLAKLYKNAGKDDKYKELVERLKKLQKK